MKLLSLKLSQELATTFFSGFRGRTAWIGSSSPSSPPSFSSSPSSFASTSGSA